jgi:hydrogenase nickel incorporation protein HypA/HybF
MANRPHRGRTVHELTLARNMLDTIAVHLADGRRLLSATVTVGLFAGVEVESLRFSFVELAKAEGLGEPELVVNRPAPRAHCNDCGADYDLTDVLMTCPTCSSLNRRVSGGFEFTLDSIEVEETEGDEAAEAH